MYSYWRSTRSPLYSFLFTVPLFLIYEIGIFLTSSDDMFVLRNGADALMRQILATFGITGLYWIGVIFFIGFIITFILQRKFWEETQIHSDYFLLMTVESVGWSVLIYFLMTNVYFLYQADSGKA